MAEYEVIITRTQPPCGGKDARVYEFVVAELEDFAAFIKAREPDLPGGTKFEMAVNAEGAVTVSFERGAQTVTYEFDEA